MKQGRASSDTTGATKPGIKTSNINVPGVAQMGGKVAYPQAVEPLVSSRGVEAPQGKSTTHPSGSQGKHR